MSPNFPGMDETLRRAQENEAVEPEDSMWGVVADRLRNASDRISEIPEDAMYGLGEIGNRIRYDMDGAELQRHINAGDVPGSTPNPGLDTEEREGRRAAAYYYAKAHPIVAPLTQGLVNKLKSIQAGGLNPFADAPERIPELHRVANQASRIATLENIADIASPDVGGRNPIVGLLASAASGLAGRDEPEENDWAAMMNRR